MLKNFEVIARPLATPIHPNPPAIRVQVFAPDEIVAKSHFWAVARHGARLKKSHGEILSVKQVLEPEPTRVKNYGVWLSYKSVRGTHNIYKEYRDITTEGAVLRLYQEMSGTHNCHPEMINIIRISEVQSGDVQHRHVEQFCEPTVKFPIAQKPIRPAHPCQKRLISKKRPTVCGF